MTPLAPQNVPDTHCPHHLPSDNCGCSTTTRLSTLADLAETPTTPTIPIRSTSPSTFLDEYSSLSGYETDTASVQAAKISGWRRARRWLSSNNLRAGTLANLIRDPSPPFVERSRLRGPARAASSASLLPIQPPPVEDDDCRHANEAPGSMHQAKINFDPVHEAVRPVIPEGPSVAPDCSSSLPGEMTVHSVSMSVKGVFELSLCTESPTRLEITQVKRRV